jgi:hypothetical protein
MKLTFSKTMLKDLKQLNRLGSLKLTDLDILPEDNPITSFRFLRAFVVFLFPKTLIRFNQEEITDQERQQALQQFTPLKSAMAHIPSGLLSKSQIQIMYGHCFKDVSDADDSDLENDTMKISAHEKLIQSIVTESVDEFNKNAAFEVQWKQMMESLLECDI